MGTTDETDRGEKASSDYFEVAKQAAARGEPHRMLEALALSGFLDGLVRSLSQHRGLRAVGGASFVAGDRLSIVNENPVDATLADISLMLKASRT